MDTDAELLHRAQTGDSPAFDRLVDRHSSAIMAVVLARVRDRAVAAEITQEVFVRLYKGLSKFRGDASLRTWLVRVALNLCADEDRRARRSRRFVAIDAHHDVFIETGASPEETVAHQSDADRVRRAIGRLPDPLRITIVLRYDAELAYREIAAATGTPLGTVGTRLTRALQLLKSALEGTS